MNQIMQDKRMNFELKKMVATAVSEVLSDPDYGLKVKKSFAKKLLSRSKKKEKRGLRRGLTSPNLPKIVNNLVVFRLDTGIY